LARAIDVRHDDKVLGIAFVQDCIAAGAFPLEPEVFVEQIAGELPARTVSDEFSFE
jgi:hypothetical protein